MDDLFAAQPSPVDHRCLGCGQVHADAGEATLVDGSVVSTYSDAWRQECEARAIMAMPGLRARQEHLVKIERKRGKAAADQLRDVMLAIWAKSKGANVA